MFIKYTIIILKINKSVHNFICDDKYRNCAPIDFLTHIALADTIETRPSAVFVIDMPCPLHERMDCFLIYNTNKNTRL